MAITNNVNNVSYTDKPMFMAYLPSNDADQTGNGGTFTLGNNVAVTVDFDNNNNMSTGGVFTAPHAGYYQFCAAVEFNDLLLATDIDISIVTTLRTFSNKTSRSALASNFGASVSILARMNTNDTASVTAVIDGEVSDRADAIAARCFFSGFYIGGA